VAALEAWRSLPLYRRKQVILVSVAVIITAAILWRTRAVLGPYLVGLALAYFLAPVVKTIERGFRWLGQRRRLGFLSRVARPLALALSYLLVVATLVGFFALFVPLVVEQGKALWQEREALWDYITRFTDNVAAQYQLLPDEIRVRVDETLSRFGEMVGQLVQQALRGTAIVISYTFSLVLAIFIIPFWTFFLLLDSRKLRDSATSTIPASLLDDVVAISKLADSVFGAYLRGQLFLGLLIGVVSTIAFTIMGLRFSLVLGLMAGVFEMIPNIGPVLGGIPAVLVGLTQGPRYWIPALIWAVAIQQIENIFIAPRVVGRSVQLHPVLVMVVLVIGTELGGVVGLFLAPVITAALRDLFRYVYYRISEEPLTPHDALKLVLRAEKFRVDV